MTKSIITTPNYYGGTCNAPQQHIMTDSEIVGSLINCDPDGEPTELAKLITAEIGDDYQSAENTPAEMSEKLAGLIIAELDSGTYYLSNGEAGRPTYEIVEADAPLADRGEDCRDASNVDGFGELISEDDLPAGVAKDLEGNVEWHRSAGDYDIYTESTTRENADGDEIRYTIVFCPTSLAQQAAGDDLGNVNWSNAAYFVE